MSSTALVVHDNAGTIAARSERPTLLRPIAAPAEVIEAQNETRAMVHKALVKGRDFGTIPGAGDKPTMLKPGAERVALAFGCYYGTPEILEQEIDHDREVRWIKTKWVDKPKPANADDLKAQGIGRNKKFGQKWVWQEKADERGASLGLYRYVVRVPVVNRATGEVVGSGVGACSSMESKYIDRPRDCENTVLKMAHKRAMVAACLVTFGLSDEFTQDVEDMAQFGGDAPAATEGGDAQTEDAEVVEEPKITTVEQALAMPLPGGPKAWNGQGGTPLGQLDAKMIPAIRRWIDGKITEAEQRDGEAPPVHYELRKACDLILEMRKAAAEKDQTKMDLGGASAGSGAPAANPTELAPGKIEDALDPPTREPARPARSAKAEPAPPPRDPARLRELSTRAGQLMQDEKFADAADEKAVFKQRFDAADTVAAMDKLVADLEKYLELPF